MANCAATVPSYVEPDCQAIDKGRIVACAFIDESVDLDSPVDITDPSVWTGQTYEGDILIHKEVNGAKPPGSPTEIEGKGSQAVRTTGTQYEATMRIAAIKGNDDYWSALNKAENYKFAYVTGEDYSILHYVNRIVSIFADADIQSGTDTEIDWVVVVKWADINLPTTSDVPVGTFEP